MMKSQFEMLLNDGYAIVPEAVSLKKLAHLRAAISELPAAHAHRNLLTRPAIQEFALSAKALALITPILGPTAFPVRGILFDKLPGANWKVAWHQDLSIAVKEKHAVSGYGPWSIKDGVPHVQPPAVILENMLTLRLHLDDCFEDNGPVRVLPGSHVKGILSAEQIQMLRTRLPEIATVTAAAGVLLMRPLLLHASSPATTATHRRVIHIEYASGALVSPLEWHAA